MRIEVDLSRVEENPAPLFARRAVNVMGTLVGGMKLVELTKAETIHSSRVGEVTVTLTSSPRNPLGELAASPAGPARYLKRNFGAGSGAQGPTDLGDADAAWVAAQVLRPSAVTVTRRTLLPEAPGVRTRGRPARSVQAGQSTRPMSARKAECSGWRVQ